MDFNLRLFCIIFAGLALVATGSVMGAVHVKESAELIRLTIIPVFTLAAIASVGLGQWLVNNRGVLNFLISSYASMGIVFALVFIYGVPAALCFIFGTLLLRLGLVREPEPKYLRRP